MLRSDWLSYYQAICYSPLVAKSAGFLATKKDKSLALSCFVSIFLTNQLEFTKTIIPLALMASESLALKAKGQRPNELLNSPFPVLSLKFQVAGYMQLVGGELYSQEVLGSIQVSEKLPTYPSPKSTLTLTSHLGQNVGLGEGQVGSFPKT